MSCGTATLLEDLTYSPAARVDRDKGLVRGVKVLGLTSGNKRRYTMEALKKAKQLYESCRINVNHPGKATDPRNAEDRIGWLENIQLKDDGLYGDLRLLKAHPMTERILEAAESNPRLFGLSHNADGRLSAQKDRDGYEIVEAIEAVRSVDIVPDPATNKSLFESLEYPMAQITFRALLESASTDKRLPAGGRKQILSILEADDLPGLDTEMPAPAPEGDMGGDPEAALRDGFKAAINGCLDGEDDVGTMIKKIKDLLKAREQALGAVNGDKPKESETETTTESDDNDEDDDEESDDKKKKDTPMSESQKHHPKGTPLTEQEAARWCKLAGVEPKKQLLETLQKLPSQESATALLEYLKAEQAPKTPARATGPRSSAPRPILEHKETKVPEDRKAWLKSLRVARRVPATPDDE